MTRILVAALVALAVHADASAGPHDAPNGPVCGYRVNAGGYSRLHYWAPNLYRLRAHFAPSISQYTSEQYPFVPPSVQVIRYRCLSVDSAERYANTGLPYDPALQIIVPPAATAAPR